MRTFVSDILCYGRSLKAPMGYYFPNLPIPCTKGSPSHNCPWKWWSTSLRSLSKPFRFREYSSGFRHSWRSLDTHCWPMRWITLMTPSNNSLQLVPILLSNRNQYSFEERSGLRVKNYWLFWSEKNLDLVLCVSCLTQNTLCGPLAKRPSKTKAIWFCKVKEMSAATSSTHKKRHTGGKVHELLSVFWPSCMAHLANNLARNWRSNACS